jgi:hypothetical protein
LRARSAATDLLSGIAAGLTAAWLMNLFQDRLSRAIGLDRSGETAATKAADALSEDVSGEPVKRSRKQDADTVLHYATGALAGGIYGLTAGRIPGVGAGRGLWYGASLWVAADEILVPALGLSPPPGETPVAEQGFGLASHLVFGLALDFCRRRIRA